ncbi:MAG: hypothetical protein FWG88_08585 [Oscillospiraceae bacterium]|nr:hypothetical protein [Oscillospiraceae bacterium]
MVKKYLAIVICLSAIIFAGSCKGESTSSNNTPEAIDTANDVIVESSESSEHISINDSFEIGFDKLEFGELEFDELEFGELIYEASHFKIYDLTENHKPKYRYIIYNSLGDIVKDTTMWRQPYINYIFDETALSILWGVGTGTYQVYYYDIHEDAFSQIFMSVIVEGHDMIVYAMWIDNEIKLVVQNPFDPLLFYTEIGINCIRAVNPREAIRDIEFVDEMTLIVTYLSEDKSGYKTETIHIMQEN